MANSYTTLATLKDSGTLGLTATTNDTQLLRIIEESSRLIDRYTDRFYYIYEGTLYQDGGATRVVLDFDLQAITGNTTSLTVDTDGDSVYESGYTTDLGTQTTSPDAFAYPQNTFPKTRLEANPWGSYGHLGAGIRKAIKITGKFGYGADWPADYVVGSGTVIATGISTSEVALVASTPGLLSAGMTLRLNSSEQVYVTAATSTTATIRRGVNGTAAASSGDGTSIQVYQYPAAITQACVIQTIRSWKRRESGYVNTIINTDMGNVQVFKGLDPDVKEIIREYRRERVPRYL